MIRYDVHMNYVSSLRTQATLCAWFFLCVCSSFRVYTLGRDIRYMVTQSRIAKQAVIHQLYGSRWVYVIHTTRRYYYHHQHTTHPTSLTLSLNFDLPASDIYMYIYCRMYRTQYDHSIVSMALHLNYKCNAMWICTHNILVKQLCIVLYQMSTLILSASSGPSSFLSIVLRKARFPSVTQEGSVYVYMFVNSCFFPMYMSKVCLVCFIAVIG